MDLLALSRHLAAQVLLGHTEQAHRCRVNERLPGRAHSSEAELGITGCPDLADDHNVEIAVELPCDRDRHGQAAAWNGQDKRVHEA